MTAKNDSIVQHVILIPYLEEFQWSLGVEQAGQLLRLGNAVQVIELTYLNRNSGLDLVRRCFGYSKINISIKEAMRGDGIETKRMISWRLPIILKVSSSNEGYFERGDINAEAAYPSLVDKLRTEHFLVKENRSLIRKEMSNAIQSHSFVQKLLKKYPRENTVFYTPNGRYTRNYAIANSLQANGYVVNIIENAKRGTLLLWKNAQSFEEHESLIERHWENANLETKIVVSQSYMESRVSPTRGDNVMWKSYMNERETYKWDPVHKYCIFYLLFIILH